MKSGAVPLLLTLFNLLDFSIGKKIWFLQLKDWKSEGISNLPGVISLLAGLLMWVTSLPGVRRINFELFFYTHQLYVVFVVFLAMHVGDFLFTMAAAGIFLFMLDRFLRFCQSRKTVDILSARSFPCDTVELIISKPASNIIDSFICIYTCIYIYIFHIFCQMLYAAIELFCFLSPCRSAV